MPEITHKTLRSVTNQLACSVQQATEATTLSKAFLWNEIRAGKLKSRRIGRRVLVMMDDLRNYLDERGLVN